MRDLLFMDQLMIVVPFPDLSTNPMSSNLEAFSITALLDRFVTLTSSVVVIVSAAPTL